MTKTVAVFNQKGGAGKTTTAVTLAADLAERGVPVDLIDADKQDGSASEWLLPQWERVPQEQQYDLSHALLKDDVPLEKVLWPTVVPKLYIAPSFESLEEVDNRRIPGADTLLLDLIEDTDASPSARKTGARIIDCGPHLGQMTITALAAADEVVVPVKVGGQDFKGLRQLNRTLAQVRRRLAPKQRTAAVLITDKHNDGLTDEVGEQLLADYPDALHAGIRHTVRVAEASHAEESLTTYAPSCTAMEDYRGVTKVVFGDVLAEWGVA